MSDIPAAWRVFKVFCIIQMVMVTLYLVISVSGIFYNTNIFWRMFESICYGMMMIFLYQGFSILNDNYPDVALTTKQKRSFNIFFLVNFLLIAFVFAKVVSQWRYTGLIISEYDHTTRGAVFIILPFLMSLFAFIFHIMFLFGMYRLRIIIHQNSSRIMDID